MKNINVFFSSCLLGALMLSLSGCWSCSSCDCCCCKKGGNVQSGEKAGQQCVDGCSCGDKECNCCQDCKCGCCAGESCACKHEHSENVKDSKTNIGGENKMSENMDKAGSRQRSNSGLEWEVIKTGQGETPKRGQVVTVHYTGWLNEGGKPGKKFDSSVDRGQKFQFVIGVGQVIQGWDEGVMSMKKGEKRMIYIPSNLAYGTRGAGSVIAPNSNLIFEVELFDMQ